MESGENVVTADAGAASPAASGSALSADQILDNAEAAYQANDGGQPADDAEAATTEETPEQPEAEAQAKPETAESEEDPTEERFAEQATPAAWKDALKSIQATNPAVAKQIRAEHYQLAQYKEALPLEEARDIRSMFPTAEEARAAHGARADLLAMDASLKTDPFGFVGYLEKNYPESFQQIKDNWPQRLYDSNPMEYRERYAKPMVNTFLAHWAENGSELEQEAAKILAQADNQWQTRDAGRFNPQDDYLVRRNQFLEQQAASRGQQDIQAFNQSLDSAYIEKTRAAIGNALERVGATALTKEAKAEVIQKVMVTLGNKLKGDNYVRTVLNQQIQTGPRTPQQQQQLLEFLSVRVKPLIGSALKSALSDYSKLMVPANAERHEKERQAASRKPVATGQAPGARTDRMDRNDPKLRDRKAFSDDDILEMAASGRLA